MNKWLNDCWTVGLAVMLCFICMQFQRLILGLWDDFIFSCYWSCYEFEIKTELNWTWTFRLISLNSKCLVVIDIQSVERHMNKHWHDHSRFMAGHQARDFTLFIIKLSSSAPLQHWEWPPQFPVFQTRLTRHIFHYVFWMGVASHLGKSSSCHSSLSSTPSILSLASVVATDSRRSRLPKTRVQKIYLNTTCS